MTKDQSPLRVSENEQPEPQVVLREPVTISQLLCGDVPRQKKYADQAVESVYDIFATTEEIYPTLIDDGQSQKITIFCPPLAGKELQHFFHFAAPSKTFGLDYNDTQQDWTELYNDPNNAKRLANHRRIPGWNIYEKYREFLRDFIQEDRDSPEGANKFIVPVISVNKSGNDVVWDFDELTDDKLIPNEFTSGITDEAPYTSLPVLGPLFIAAYSPQVTTAWGDYQNYDLDQNSRGKRNVMGATQVLPLTIAFSESLLSSPLFNKLMDYTLTGEIPTPEPHGNRIDEQKESPTFMMEGVIFKAATGKTQ